MTTPYATRAVSSTFLSLTPFSISVTHYLESTLTMFIHSRPEAMVNHSINITVDYVFSQNLISIIYSTTINTNSIHKSI